MDNNIVERSLKRAVLHRKNSLFYRTLNGAPRSNLRRQNGRRYLSLTRCWKFLDKVLATSRQAGLGINVLFDPSGNGVAYAALADWQDSTSNGLYKSSDSGAIWAQLSGGLPKTVLAGVRWSRR